MRFPSPSVSDRTGPLHIAAAPPFTGLPRQISYASETEATSMLTPGPMVELTAIFFI